MMNEVTATGPDLHRSLPWSSVHGYAGTYTRNQTFIAIQSLRAAFQFLFKLSWRILNTFSKKKEKKKDPLEGREKEVIVP